MDRPTLAGIAREHAAFCAWRVRDTLWQLGRMDNFEQKRNLLAVLGYEIPRDERELDLITRTLRKSVSTSRSGGIH